MRIIGGAFKGTCLASLKDDIVRPTGDKVRQALFNILGPDILGSSFLDLYSGTGAVALEALSRGAGYVTTVELTHIDLIQKNCAKCRVSPSDTFKVIRGDTVAAMRELIDRGIEFNIIFADPPWREGAPGNFLYLADALLKNGGQLIIESYRKTAKPKLSSDLALQATSCRYYGKTALNFFRKP